MGLNGARVQQIPTGFASINSLCELIPPVRPSLGKLRMLIHQLRMLIHQLRMFDTPAEKRPVEVSSIKHALHF